MKAAVLHATNQPLQSKTSPSLPSPRPHPPPRPRLRSLPHRPPHRRRRPAALSRPLIPGHQIVGEIVEGATPALPRAHGSASPGSAAPMAPAATAASDEKISAKPHLHRLHRQRRLRRIRPRPRRLRLPLPATLDDTPRRAAPLRRHHRLPQPSRSRSRTGERVGLFGFGASAPAIAILQPGTARSTSSPAAKRIAGWPNLSAQHG